MKKVDWKSIVLRENASILEAIETIDKGQLQIALVTDNDDHLIGVITDGDIRRGLINRISLDESVTQVMNREPICLDNQASLNLIRETMVKHGIRQLPILDKDGKLENVEVKEDLVQEQSTPVVLMVGGLGTRLGDLTKNKPKPLLNVGKKPLLETIIENFRDNGFRNIYLAVNYKADMIQNYFKDGKDFGVNIKYILEKERMGTAGSLTLALDELKEPFFVMNGDILTNIDFNNLIGFHQEHGGIATMCVREYDVQVPYGIVETDGTYIKNIKEKPIQKFFINAGVYFLDPEVLDYIPSNQFFDMPEVFQKIIDDGKKTSLFPIREYWIDIGQFDDYEKASGEYQKIFEKEKC